MTLDEMIAWLEDGACMSLTIAAHFDGLQNAKEATWFREDAAARLTIENALRAVRDGVAV